MSDEAVVYTGGCLCGAVRYQAVGEPMFAGHCYCCDCRKASGSGFIPFMGFAGSAVRFSGATRRFVCTSAKGTDAVRNFCVVCGGLVYGGDVGRDTQHTVYAGTLDNPSLFTPRIAICTRGRPDWALIPEGLKVFERMPE